MGGFHVKYIGLRSIALETDSQSVRQTDKQKLCHSDRFHSVQTGRHTDRHIERQTETMPERSDSFDSVETDKQNDRIHSIKFR